MTNKLTVIALASLLSAGAAMAGGQSREEVMAELARRDAQNYSPVLVMAPSTKTRAAVLAELQAARASGELEMLNSNNPGLTPLTRATPKPQSAELLAGEPR